jgi:hypothetical protein
VFAHVGQVSFTFEGCDIACAHPLRDARGAHSTLAVVAFRSSLTDTLDSSQRKLRHSSSGGGMVSRPCCTFHRRLHAQLTAATALVAFSTYEVCAFIATHTSTRLRIRLPVAWQPRVHLAHPLGTTSHRLCSLQPREIPARPCASDAQRFHPRAYQCPTHRVCAQQEPRGAPRRVEPCCTQIKLRCSIPFCSLSRARASAVTSCTSFATK